MWEINASMLLNMLSFVNNNDSIIVKCDSNINNLPTKYLITAIEVDGISYGFYVNEPDIEYKSILFIGKTIKIPEDFKQQFNMLQRIYNLPKFNKKIKINSKSERSKVNTDARKNIVKTFFKTNEDVFKVCCIFHNDRNPSMSINLQMGTFYCFSCKTSGTIVKLVNKIRKINSD
jgi:hypothetical protein